MVIMIQLVTLLLSMTVPTLHIQVSDSVTLWEPSPVTSHSIQSKGPSLTMAFSYAVSPADLLKHHELLTLDFHFLFLQTFILQGFMSLAFVSLLKCQSSEKAPLVVLYVGICSSPTSLPFLAYFIFNFLYLFMAALGLCCWAQTFSSCGVRASHRSGFPCWGAQALECTETSVVVAVGL